MVSLSTESRRARTALRYGSAALVLGAVLTVVGAVGAVTVLVIGLVLVVAGAVAVVLARRALKARKKAEEARQEWGAAVTPYLRRWPMPRARAASDVEFGVTRTRHTDDYNPYVARGVDRSLRFALGARKFVLVKGEAKAGRARTLAEAVRHACPEAPLVIPRDVRAVAELAGLESGVPVENAVVLLGDLTATDLEHLTPSVLEFWASRAVLVGTVTEAEVQKTGAEVGVAGRMALAAATVVELPFLLSESELAAARDDFSEGPSFPDDSGIGAVLVGGAELVRRLRQGRRDSPAGQAIARAAVDARIAGLRRPITEPELVRLFPKYLERVTVGVEPTEDVFTAGLEWALAPISSEVALLRRVTGGFAVLDYVVAAEAAVALPEDAGADLLALTSVADAYGIGHAAYFAGRMELAREAFRRAMEHAESLPAAAYSLGALLVEQDDAAGAERVYRAAAESGHPVYAGSASVSLGELLLKQDKAEEAVVLFKQVLVGAGAGRARVLHGLGRALAAVGDEAGAREVYLEAASCDNPDVVAWAKGALGG